MDLKMDSNWRVNHSRSGCEISSIRSTKGYIILNNNININKGLESTYSNSNIEDKQYIAAGADTKDKTDIKDETYTCESEDVQNYYKNLENCLKRFLQEYNDIVEHKNKTKSYECSIKNEVIEKTHNKSIESYNLNCYSSNELLTSNLTWINSNTEKRTREPEKADNNSMSSLNIDNSKYYDQKENTYYENSEKTKNINNNFKKKHCSCKHNKYKYSNNEHENEKYNKQIKNSKNTFVQLENSKIQNIQKPQQRESLDDDKFYEMLDDLNNEITKIKELFTYTKNMNSFFNSNNIEINMFNEMSANDEDFINNKEYSQSEFEQYVNTNTYPIYSYNDMEFDCTNEPNIIQQTDEGFYEIQLDLKTQNLNSIHFFLLQNPYVCECGTINNK